MTKKELIKHLDNFSDDMEVMVLDSSNGGGVPREINLGPTPHRVSAEESMLTADCEGKEGLVVCALGWGCY